MELNFFKAGLKVSYENCDINDNHFLQEYLNFGQTHQFSKWKQKAAKLNLEESEKFLFEFMLSIKEDIAKLERKLNKNEGLLPLSKEGVVDALNFEYLQFLDKNLEKDKQYYARFELNSNKICIFFEAKNESLAKIIKIKPEDIALYNAFVVDIQRDMIKNRKENNE
ncbi:MULTISPECIES: hypothetical protein [unclassified Campylobacter]|uniref:hypothetical protein n=1 Tax=unclassified Campylobacter TaxID=2593542 RepID=UPI00123805CA|nr:MULTISPECIES: hypothetical protein [unclassified Campylobacter]KAA6225228.1 hypothetical protein FMM55_08125 [Campylobacter sp. LR196d]KAA6226239.1 hypothetical protein FMM54_05500 [Campylobacter sp. LR185c]KAA6228960.1 hypothetical protein FMM57_01745 [Campylobacter sp. LR286c]KAA6231441.1 hypothetical protein FMM56_04650 [Campylobacter sp. LR264d]KAA6231653.1 hypothetical protein FMM58_03440 [Campylobacter sp. LR291e]